MRPAFLLAFWIPALHLRAYFLLALTMLFWAANAVAGKLAVGHISPFLLTSMRWGIAFVAGLALGAPRLAQDWPVVRRNLPLLFGYGAIGFACFNAAFYTAAKYTSAINIVIIQAGMPLIIFIANFLLFRIRVTSGQAIGFALTMTGVIVTTSNGSLETLAGLQLNRGDALMLLAILFYGGYTVALRWKPPMHWLGFMTAASAAAFITTIPFALWEIASGEVIYPDLRGAAIGFFTALLPGFVAQITYIRGNEMIGSNRAGLFINLVPIFGTLMSILILGETLHLYHVLAIVLVLGGITLAERRKAGK
jgi:drug/metabolite transporter (DMT)-like permease